jgi:hypothetical protein
MQMIRGGEGTTPSKGNVGKNGATRRSARKRAS